MLGLKERLEQQIPGLRQQAREIIKRHGKKVISQVTVSQAFGGMRGVTGLVCDTSVVDADQGLAIRGIPIAKLSHRLPEEIFYLLCTGISFAPESCPTRKRWPRCNRNFASARPCRLTYGAW